ncbi:MAG TPA: HYR domain-containing protein [Bacteroidales bacterium]|nr:HYR domain-containing protein [Bacteroidales bacterium]
MKRTITFILLGFLISTLIQAQDWQEILKIEASDGESNDYFGSSIDISGDYAIIGAYLDDPINAPSFASREAGSAYIFHNNNGTWEEVQKIWALDATAHDKFGYSVAISGDYAVIGAYEDREDTSGNNPLFRAGSAYLFHNEAGIWKQVKKLVPETRYSSSVFGQHVAISGNNAIITTNGSTDRAVYVFSNISGNWQQTQRIADAHINSFISSFTMEDSIFVLGLASTSTHRGGSCSVYKNVSGTWTFQQEFSPEDPSGIGDFGYSVDLSGDYMIIGAPFYFTPNNYGYAYIYQNISGTWMEKQRITAADVAKSDYFGLSVVIRDKYALVGAPYEDEDILGNDSICDAGSAYLFFNDNGNWVQKNKIVPSVRDDYGNFGEVMAIDGKYAMIDGFRYNTNKGAVFCYEKMNTPEISVQPENIENICSGVNVRFTVSGSYINSYQWQLSVDSGKIFTNLSDDTIYSNTTSQTLTIKEVNNELEGYLYRCVLTNQYGNTESHSVFFTIDIENPVISFAPDDQILPENCEASLPDYTGNISVTDNCDVNPIITQDPQSGTIISGTTNPVTIKATDHSGNYTTITFNVALSDTISPVIVSNHEDITLPKDNNCVAKLPDFTGDVLATDNCDTNLTITQYPAAGKYIYSDTNLITITVRDDFNNATNVSFNVAAVDDTPPYIVSAHNDDTLTSDNNGNAVLPDYSASVDARDHCTATADLKMTQNPAPGTVISGDVNQIKLTVSDASGNQKDISFNVVVESTNSALSITSTHHDTILPEVSNCMAILPDFTKSVRTSGGTNINITQNPAPGTDISGNLNYVTLTANDDSGKEASVYFNVSVEDTIAPVISCMENQTVTAGDDDFYTVNGTELDPLSKDDNCGIKNLVNNFNNLSSLIGAKLPVGIKTIKWTVYDTGGNKSSCTFDVTVNKVTTSVASLQKSGISVYPNPTTGKIYIKCTTQNIQALNILDVFGKKVVEKNYSSENRTIDLSELKNGIYILNILTANEVYTTKIVKE